MRREIRAEDAGGAVVPLAAWRRRLLHGADRAAKVVEVVPSAGRLQPVGFVK